MPEINFDGLVGPTHHYAGLSAGNLASMANRSTPANPREAALQGLAKMRFLARLGVPQAVLPPLERPSVRALRHLGFAGTDEQVLARAAAEAPALLSACSSASAMWTANACTVSPSADTADRRVHLTPANLASKLHRALEAPETAAILRAVFASPDHFVHHEPLAGGAALGDEGAANHTRFTAGGDGPGLHFFVWGQQALGRAASHPRRFPARQSHEASAAVARRHGLAAEHVVFAQQNPVAIDAGVFHNDVIAVGHEGFLLHHEQAFVHTRETVVELRRRYLALTGRELLVAEVPASVLPLDEAVSTYLFNSQLVTLPNGSMAMIAPGEARQSHAVLNYLEELIAGGRTPLTAVHYLDLRQSMRNGGGPACLRQRVSLTATEMATLPKGIWIDDAQHDRLVDWVNRHYRDSLSPADLADPALLDEVRRALDELTHLLGLGSVYPFQIG